MKLFSKLLSIGVLASAAVVTPAFAADPGFSATYNVSAIAQVSTGAVKLATTYLLTPSSVSIDWGDNSSSTGFAAIPCSNCDLWGIHTYASPGTYTVTVTYNVGPLSHYSTTTSAVARAIANSDFIVVSVGDSVASGEGNPDIPISGFQYPLWDDGIGNTPCHLSKEAGPAIAALLLQLQNPTQQITFLHLACTGASISSQSSDSSSIMWQIQQATNILGSHRADALLISAGANDIFPGGFGAIATTCGENDYDCSQDTNFTSQVSKGLNNLPNLYTPFGSTTTPLGLGDQVDALNPVKTYVTEYHDPTHDQNGNFPDASCTLGAFLTAEWTYFYNGIEVPLNAAVLAGVGKNAIGSAPDAVTTWHYVGNIASDFLKHGYCAGSQSWVVSIQTSFAQQGTVDGAAHPNLQGHFDIARRIVAAIDLYTTPVVSRNLFGVAQPNAWTRNLSVRMTLTTGSVKLPFAGYGGTFYSVNNGVNNCAQNPAVPYTSQLQITAEGYYTVCYGATNRFGVMDPVHSVSFGIDRTKPTTTATVNTIYPNDSVTFLASDPQPPGVNQTSGVVHTHYKIDKNGWQDLKTQCVANSGCTVPLVPGQHTVSWYSVDAAGNREATHSRTDTYQ